jgi:hypothetical protein
MKTAVARHEFSISGLGVDFGVWSIIEKNVFIRGT